MNLFEILTSFLGENFKKVEDLLNFDMKNLANLNLEKLLPIFLQFLNKKDFEKPKSSNLSPISNLADKEIIYLLNRYFSSF
ncbi:MAG: hypothetical protein E7342_03935 [Clostridiales bacterium]|nr:hypothetical protein [Clostridiales bacterium]